MTIPGLKFGQPIEMGARTESTQFGAKKDCRFRRSSLSAQGYGLAMDLASDTGLSIRTMFGLTILLQSK